LILGLIESKGIFVKITLKEIGLVNVNGRVEKTISLKYKEIKDYNDTDFLQEVYYLLLKKQIKPIVKNKIKYFYSHKYKNFIGEKIVDSKKRFFKLFENTEMCNKYLFEKYRDNIQKKIDETNKKYMLGFLEEVEEAKKIVRDELKKFKRINEGLYLTTKEKKEIRSIKLNFKALGIRNEFYYNSYPYIDNPIFKDGFVYVFKPGDPLYRDYRDIREAEYAYEQMSEEEKKELDKIGMEEFEIDF